VFFLRRFFKWWACASAKGYSKRRASGVRFFIALVRKRAARRAGLQDGFAARSDPRRRAFFKTVISFTVFFL